MGRDGTRSRQAVLTTSGQRGPYLKEKNMFAMESGVLLGKKWSESGGTAGSVPEYSDIL